MNHQCKNYKCPHQNWGECYAHITEHCDRFIPPDEKKETASVESQSHGSVENLLRLEHAGTKDAGFDAFVDKMPKEYWARYDLSAVRLGWEAHKLLWSPNDRCDLPRSGPGAR